VAEKKKKKDLSMQQILIYASLGLSVFVAIKLFLPKKNNNNQQMDAEHAAYMAEIMARHQLQQQLPEQPVNPGQNIPMLVGAQPYIPTQQRGAISSNAEAMMQRQQLESIPVREEVGINNLFLGQQQMAPTQNTINPYKNVRMYNQPQQQSIHDFSRIRHVGDDGVISDALASQKRQPVLPRQSQNLAPIGYQSNPYDSGSVI
jgi:hypothetical protein